jgi:mycothiol synthase
MTFTVRNFKDSDFYPWIEFYSRLLNKHDSSDNELYAEYLLRKFRRPGYNAQKDFFLAEEGGAIIGFADVVFEGPIKRAILNGYVLDSFRRRGVGSTLIQRLLLRSQELGAVTVHINIREPEPDAHLFLIKCGFSTIRFFYDMQIDLENRPLDDLETAGAEIGYFGRGDEESLSQLQNLIFEGSWGFCPNTAEEIRYYLVLTGCRIDDVLCLKKEGRTIGYSWYYPLPMRSDGAGMRIHMFGVDPGFRGQGWGKKILLASLERMRERKARTVELTVDSDNSPALALYSSRGFSLRSRSRWYEKQER